MTNLLLENEDKPIVMIRADAGYGKTTVAAQYVRAAGMRTAWYRLDESDTSLGVFNLYAHAALDTAEAGCSADRADEQRQLTGPLTAKAVGMSLLARLEDAIDVPTVLVLDDYHTVHESEGVGEILTTLLANVPSNLKIVLLTRTTPAINVARLRAAGQVLWLDTGDLEFSPAETRDLWRERGWPHSQVTDVPEHARTITQGWAAGLALFGDWLQRGHSVEDVSPAAFASQAQVYDYLAEEVFERQPAHVRRFLLNTCVLEEIGELEAAAVDDTDAPLALLSRIDEENVFFRRAQDTPAVYCCHPLFREFLQRRAAREHGSGHLRDNHVRAARHYRETGDPDRAVHHAACSRNVSLVRKLSGEYAGFIVHECRPDLAEKLLSVLPATARDGLELVLEGYALRCRFQVEDAADLFSRALDSIGTEAGDLRGLAIEQLAGAYIALGDFGGAAVACDTALQELSDLTRTSSVACALYLMLAFCRSRAGDMDGSRRAAKKGLSLGRRMSTAERVAVLNRYALLCFTRGDCLVARRYADKAVELTAQGAAQFHAAWVASSASEIAMELGDYGRSMELTHRSLLLAGNSPYYPEDAIVAEVNWADTALGLGDAESAASKLRKCLDAALDADDQDVAISALVALSRCARTGVSGIDDSRMARLADEYGHMPDVYIATHARLTHAAAMIASDDIPTATSELRDISKTTRKPGFGRFETWCRVLLAEIARREGRMRNCDDHLRKGLAIACENRYVHLIIVEGRIAPELLVRALKSEIETEFTCEILSRIGPWLLPQAEGLIKSGDQRLALLGIRALADTHRSWARRPLLDAVRHPDPQIAKSAAEALASLPVQQEEKLRITAFGDFTVECGDREVMFRKRKSKHLLEYLFINRKRRLARDVVIDTFWEDSAPKAALNNFHVTFHAVKRALNPHLQRREQLPYFDLSGDSLQLVAETFSSDVDDFLEAHGEAKRMVAAGTIDGAIEKLEECRQLYSGDLMDDNLYEDWVFEARDELRETYFEAMDQLAGLLDRKEDHQGASRILRRLVAKDRTREELHLKIAEQCVKMGNRALAVSQLKFCERVLQQDLGVKMSPATRRAFEKLLEASASKESGD